MTDYGHRVPQDPTREALRFERTFDVAVDELWDALTSPERLAVWLADAAVEWRVGGAVTLRFGPDEHAVGEVLVYQPPTVLEYTWRWRDEPTSAVRFELIPDGERTRLVLLHRQLLRTSGTSYGAGWHAHLDALAAHLCGDDFEWGPRFRELERAYAKGARP